MSSPASEPRGQPPPSVPPSSISVLLVEDNQGDARLFEQHLDESPVEATLRHEETLQDGLRSLGESRPDVLVANLDLPDSEGAETVKTVAAAAPEIPIVVLTGQEELKVALEAQEAGATEYLQKENLTPALVERTLRWALQRSRMQAKLRQRDAWIRSITEGLSAGIFRAGPTGHIEYANEALTKMLGADGEEELIGRDLTTFYTDSAQRGQMLAQEEAEGVEVEFDRLDGSAFTGLMTAEPARGRDGRVLHFDGFLVDITERVETENQLRRSRKELAETKARYESLVEDVFDSAPVGAFVLDSNFQVVWVNEATETFFGLDREEIIGADKHRLIQDHIKQTLEAPDAFAEAVEATYRDNTHVEQFECHVLPGAEREERWLEHRSRPVEHGQYEGGRVEIYSDITDRKKREQKLQILSEALGQAKESVLITEGKPLDEPGPEVVYVNDAFETMTGYAEEEILGKTPRVLQGPETEQEVLDSLREALQAGEEWQGETINYRKDGTPYRVQWNLAPVRGKEGEIKHWVSVQRDVTEERRREERLRLLARALKQVGDKVVITDREGQIEYVNEAFEEMTGYSEEDVLGENPEILQSGEHDDEFYEELWETLQSGEAFQTEFINERKDGTRYVEDERISPITDAEGQITHFVSAGRDITDDRAREKELRQQRNLLAQAQRLAGAWEIDLRAEEVSASEKVYEIHEMEPGTKIEVEELLGFYPPETHTQVRTAFEKCAEAGTPYDLEVPLQTAKGNRRWVRTVGAPAEIEDGEVVRIAGAFQDITDRKRHERELERYREYTGDILNAIDDVFYILDGQGNLERWNRSFSEVTGYSDNEIADMHGTDFFAEQEAAKIESAIEEAFETGSVVVEAPYLTKEGTLVPHELVATLVEDPDGNRKVAGIGRDITDRKRRERELRKKERRYQAVFEDPNLLVALLDADGTPLEVNQTAMTQLNVSPEREEKEKPLWETEWFKETEVLQSEVQEWIQRAASGEYVEFETDLSRPVGEHFIVRGTVRPIRDDAGQVRSLLITGTDVTDRRHKEEALREERDRRTALFENASDPIMEVRFENEVPIITEVNPAFETTFGIGDNDVPGISVSDAVVPTSRQENHVHIRERVLRGERVEKEVRRETVEGLRDFIIRVIPMDVDGDSKGAYAWYTDITERKRREEALKRAKEKAEEAAQLKSSMMANMSHEIRTPLTAITGFAQILEEELEGSLKDFAVRIQKGGERLMSTLDSVLQLSELEAGTKKLPRERVNLNEVAREVTQSLRPSAEEKSIALDLDLPEHPATGTWNEAALTRILKNLVGNAIKFTPEGGTVTIRSGLEDGDGIFEVVDTGVGISEEALPSIFEAFKQESKGLDREYEGAGLGLSIVKRLVDLFEGTIEVQSEQREGSQFTVRLPARTEEEEQN